MSDTRWMFIIDKVQKGPVSTSILMRMLRKGLVHKNSLLWTEKMAEWKPASEVESFKKYVECLECFWYFTDEDKQQQGPVSIRELAKKFNSGIIDGMTMVWTQNMSSWQQVSTICVSYAQ